MIDGILDRGLCHPVARAISSRNWLRPVLALALLTFASHSSHAFWASLSASPDPNTGDFSLSWSNPQNKNYTVEERPTGGSWSSQGSINGTSWTFTEHAPGVFSYRLKHTGFQCTGWPEPTCGPVTTYSETISVTVDEPPPPGGNNGEEDPYPPPGPFTPPNASNFPDAPIVNPSVPAGDTGLNSVGAIGANGGVSGGQASYSIPIVVPPGRKGMQPSVSINYSSSSGSGVVGVGWSLSAISTISRCSATAAQDGFTAAVQYDAIRDRLCLDGMRLMVVSGTYGASGAEYRTELDTFARIRQYSGGINGPSTYFIAEYKDGRRSWFGNVSAARFKAAGRSETMTWAVREMRDRSGNNQIYSYQNYGNGEYQVSAIDYTGYNGAVGDRHVYFDYENRSDPRTTWSAGGKTRLTKRLKKVRTAYQSSTVREYSLTYSDSLSTGRDLLRSVEECAYDSSVKHCFPPTTFAWQENATQFVTERLKFYDPNGLIPGGNPAVVHSDKRWLHDVMPHGDQNGDGVKDWDGFQVNAEGEVTATLPITLTNCFRPANGWTLTCLDADFDADGLTDSFRKNNNKFEIRFADSSVWVNTGLAWNSIGSNQAIEDSPLGFADFNGDGWVDLAIKQNSQLYVYFHTRNLNVPYSNANRQWLLTYASAPGGFSHSIDVQIYGDMDGNGTPDFVVSDIATGNQTPGLPTPNYIILTKSQFGGTMTTSTRNVPSYTSSTANANFFHDINGDGLPDLVSMLGTSSTLQYKANLGTGFANNWISLGVSIPTRFQEYELTMGEPEFALYPVTSKMLVMDYDGDGRAELLTANSVVASGCSLVLQVPPQSNEWFCDDDLYGDYLARQYTNIEQPINSAVKDNSVRNYRAHRFDENAAGNIVVTSFNTDIFASASQTAAIDATGDGLPDVVTVLGCRLTACEFNLETAGRSGTIQNSTYVEGAWINRNLGTAVPTGAQEFEYEGYDLMRAAEDAFGNRHEWTYKPLSSDAYDKSNTSFYETTHSYQAAEPDYFHFASSMYVVAEHKGSNGIGGMNGTLYRYRGAIFNNKGRGFQGFKTVVTEEDVYASTHSLANTDKVSRTDFHQKWPTSSQIEKACTFLAVDGYFDDNPNCTSAISLTTVNTIHNVATAGGARFVAVKNQTEKSFDLTTRALLSTQATARNFDTAGNVTYESTSHTDSWTTNLAETTNGYLLNWPSWWLNRVTSTKLKSNPVSARHSSSPTVTTAQDAVKEVTTSFTQYNATHRLPTTVTTSGNDTALTKTVTSAYNTYGLPTSISTTGTDVSGPRTVTTNYSKNGIAQSTDGYFPYTITNAFGHQTEHRTAPKHGVPTQQWDANDLLTVTDYDAFGRVSAVTGPGTPTSYTRYEWCDGAVWCYTANSAYRIYTTSAGAPFQYEYIDKFGRSIFSLTRTFSNTNYTRVVSTFDERGNQRLVSQPFDPSAGETGYHYTRFLTYDALGRLRYKDVKQTNGQILATTYGYSGFKTTINAGGILMHRIHNGIGQLVETKDGEGGLTRYAYDGAGNPVVLQDPKMINMSGNVGIKAAFNSLGQKLWIEDPDWWKTTTQTYGRKFFIYSALGEVLSETDPNGNLIELFYDELGRMTDRKVNGSLIGKWHYDNTDAYKGLGLLDFEDSQFRPDGSRLQKFYYYNTPLSGRKDLLQVTHRFYENGDQNDFEEYDTAFFTDNFYTRPKGLRYPGGASVAYTYSTLGYLIEEKDPLSGVVYRNVSSRGSRSEILAASIGKHAGSFKYTYSANYFSESGQAQSITVSNGGSNALDLAYTYDVFGNVATRSTGVGGTSTETLYYDDVQRLISTFRSFSSGGSSNVTYNYDASGNFTVKSDYASSYSYHSSRPHVLTSVNKYSGGAAVFVFDDNGNMTRGDGENVIYNAFNKPTSIENFAGTSSASFTYGADLLRFRQTTPEGSTIYYVDNLMEIESLGTSTDFRHFVGDIAILTKTGDLSDPNPGINYLFRDRLGSVAAVADTSGINVESRGSDAFGKPRAGDWTDKIPPTLDSNVTNRGFTDHEHLDDWQLIHMNGRAYDYNIGRFLSVDPIIQAPGNSQSINPYVYVMNNPLSGIDPSGYCSTQDSLNDCAASLDAGVTQELTNENGDVVGHVGKDSDGNLYLTNNGSAAGQSTVQSAINANDKPSGSIDQIGSIDEVGSTGQSGPQDHISALQELYDNKGALGKVGERLSNVGSLFKTDAAVAQGNYNDLLELMEYCTPNCDFGYLDLNTVELFSNYMAAPASLYTGGLAVGAVGATQRLGAASRSAKAVPDGRFYSVAHEMRLSSRSYPGVDRTLHFREANENLLRAMGRDPDFANIMSQLGINVKRTPTGLAPRTSPANWTWHHAESPGVMQLVPRSQHAPGSVFQNTLHPGNKGGFANWGKQ